MAGHSKWKNIQHRKGAQDARRGKIFTKHIRAITSAARQGEPNPAENSALRLAIDRAYADNMPKDNIERAIKRGSGDNGDAIMENIRYEGYGPQGAAVMVDCLTDNRNRSVAEVRYAFSKVGGNMGTSGSVAYLFQKKGVILIEDAQEDAVIDVALDAGADDISHEDNIIEVTTAEDNFVTVRDALKNANFKICSAEIYEVPDNYIELDEESSEKMIKLIELLEDLDDVQSVSTNADLTVN